jgi:DNA-binding response OmpR family regulator
MAEERRIRVLFIDDDGSIRVFAAAMFNERTFDIKVAASTKEADGFLSKMTFDIIVCDVMMPDEDGLHYCNRLKTSGNKIPFIFLSAISRPEAVQQGLASGANAYFIKPFDARELQTKIIRLVASTVKLKPAPPDKEPKGKMKWFGR